ncbi:MAG TPA: hypothetical protein VEY93_11335, partial [Longimicrobium sp.]|nr:hypothetical protein [Longimicrobium sp.]
MSILRPSRILMAVALACAAAPSAAQQPREPRPEIGVMPYFGTAYSAAVQAGLQIQVRPSADSEWTFFADYNRWLWGLVCVDYALVNGDGSTYYDDRCGEEGNAMHVGAMRTFNRAGNWQPYVSAGAGLSEVVTKEKDDRPSFLLETGVDVGGGRMLNGRLGVRYQTRPGAGGGGLPADFVGPVMALRLT